MADGQGRAYVNSIGFDFPGGEFAPGLVALVGTDGSTRVVAEGLAFPNGMAISPDGSTLVVAESYGEKLTAYPIADDGSLGDARTWAATPGDHPDGICFDASGALWYADVGNEHCVRVREGGEVLDTVDSDRGAFACALSRDGDAAAAGRRPGVGRERVGRTAHRAAGGLRGSRAGRRLAVTGALAS